MRPEDLSVVLRPRRGFEAVDLGMALSRRAGIALLAPVALLVLGVTVFAFFAMRLEVEPSRTSEWAWFLVWWLKPLYDRVALHVLSREVFGARPSLRETARATGAAITGSGLLAALTWQRLSPMRALHLAVPVLEGLHGAPGRARRRLLSRRVGGSAFGLLSACALFELALMLGLYTLVPLIGLDSLGASPPWESLLELTGHGNAQGASAWDLLVYATAVCVVECFYVGGGFGLYLKRRTDLEAWDVELELRAVPERTRAASGSTVTAAGLVAIVALLAGPDPTMAAVGNAGPDAREAAARAAPSRIESVLSAPEFGARRTVRTLRLRRQPQAPGTDETPAWLAELIDAAVEIGRWLAGGVRVLAYAALAVLVAGLTWLVVREIRAARPARDGPVPPAWIGEFDIRPASLPADVAGATRNLLDAGRPRDALALLYRGALSHLAHAEGIAFRAADTEGECLARVARAASPSEAAFARLLAVWQRVAYARQPPPEDEALSLCRAWSTTFGRVP